MATDGPSPYRKRAPQMHLEHVEARITNICANHLANCELRGIKINPKQVAIIIDTIGNVAAVFQSGCLPETKRSIAELLAQLCDEVLANTERGV